MLDNPPRPPILSIMPVVGASRCLHLRSSNYEQGHLRTISPRQKLAFSTRSRFKAGTDGRDICHLEFRVVDAQGVRVPDAEPELTFTTDGPAKIIGIENGDLNDPATGKDGVRKAYHGRGLAIVQSSHQAGKVRVRARANGLNEALVEIETKP